MIIMHESQYITVMIAYWNFLICIVVIESRYKFFYKSRNCNDFPIAISLYYPDFLFFHQKEHASSSVYDNV